MKAVELFGKQLRPMMEYVGWMLSIDAHAVLDNYCHLEKYENFEEVDSAFVSIVNKAHTFLSQPMKEEWFVRGREPEKSDYWTIEDELFSASFDQKVKYQLEHNKWKNWQPLFKGEWVIINSKTSVDYRDAIRQVDFNGTLEIWLSHFKTLNAFATYCHDLAIKLELNEELEI